MEDNHIQVARYKKAYNNYFRQASHGLKKKILQAKEDATYKDKDVDKFIQSVINAAEK